MFLVILALVSLLASTTPASPQAGYSISSSHSISHTSSTYHSTSHTTSASASPTLSVPKYGNGSLANAPYKDPSVPIEDRINDLIGRMTIEEKTSQLMQGDITNWMNGMWMNQHICLGALCAFAIHSHIVRTTMVARESLLTWRSTSHGRYFKSNRPRTQLRTKSRAFLRRLPNQLGLARRQRKERSRLCCERDTTWDSCYRPD
jgi:hypothetical protein